MKRVGVIGLGDMGWGMARNLYRAGFAVTGFDLRAERRQMLSNLGGHAAQSGREAGAAADVLFVMVLNGRQVLDALQGDQGVLAGMKPGSTVVISATIKPAEARQVTEVCTAAGVRVLDSPVSGGQPGAASGTLAMMVAGDKTVLEAHRDVFDAVGGKIMHVGSEVGQGQTVKAALQALIGTTFIAVFEALVLGSKAGISGAVMEEVFGASHVGSPLIMGCIEKVRGRQFVDTGSNMATIYKDLTITMDLARQEGVSLFATSTAMELFQAGISSFPGEDNWAVVKLLEQIAGTEVD